MSSVLLLKSVLTVLAVVMTWSSPVPKNYTPHDEAEYIALDAIDSDLLPNPELVTKIEGTIVQIRKEFPRVEKVRNQGNWFLGRVLVTNYSSELKDKISTSSFGPLKDVKVKADKSSEAELYFDKPYQPDRLSDELAKLGADAQAIWFDKDEVPDLGHIRYDPEENTYSFREGLANCGPDCRENRYWTYKVDDKTKKITLEGEYATGVPRPNVRE